MKFNMSYLKRWAKQIYNKDQDRNHYDNSMPIDWNIDQFANWFLGNAVDNANVANSFTEKVFGIPKGTKLSFLFSKNDGSGFNKDRYWQRFGSSKSALYDVWGYLKPKLGGKHNSLDPALSSESVNRKYVSVIESIVRKIMTEQKYVKFDSHRSRDKAERVLGTLPRAKASFRYNDHYYPLDDDQISRISSIKGVKVVNKLPGDPDSWINAR